MADKSLGFNIFMDADTKKAEAKVGAFAESMQRRIERAVRSLPEIDLKANASQVDRRIQEIRRELATLATQRIGIDIDAGTAQARIERLRGELVRLGSESPNIQVQADTARAAAALGAVSAQARRLDGETVNVTVNARDAVRTVSMLGLIVAGLSAVSAAAVPAAAALAALPTLGSAAIQGVGTIVAGFSGVGDAVKALGDAETKAAAGTAQSASSRVNSAQAIIGAQRSLEAAVTSADRAAITGAQQVADARDQVTATYEQGLDRVASAEADYTRAQEESQTATEDLTRARADAQEQIEDLGRSLRGAALDEREAQIRLAEAQDRLTAARASGTSGREIEKLQIDAEQAALALENAADRRDDLTKEQQKADQLGVNGTDQVVTAQKRADAAAKAVTASEKALGAARDQATKDNTRAQLQLARTIQQASWSQADASRSVEDAQRALANAYEDTGASGAAAMNKVNEAMQGLSPETQHFARFIVSDVLPGLRHIRDGIQAALLPKMETSLRNLSLLGPDVERGLAGTAGVIGDLAVKGSEMVTSGPWRRDFPVIVERNTRVFEDFGNSGLDLLDMFRSLSIGSGPMVERFSQFVERSTAAGRAFLDTKQRTGELQRFFDQAGDTLAEFGDILRDIVVGGTQLAITLGPIGGVLLRQIANLIAWVGEMSQAHPVLVELIGTLVIGAAAFSKIGNIIAGAGVALPAMIGGWRTLIGVMGGLSPTAVAGGTAMTSVSRGLDAAALSAGIYTEKITGSANAGEKVATTGAKVSSALTRVGAALPVAGVAVVALATAYELLVTSADEAANVMIKGGAAADQMTLTMQNQNRTVSSWLEYIPVAGSYLSALNDKFEIFAPTLADATAEMEKQRAAMDPLSRATSDAARAQADYLAALEAGDMARAEDAYRRFTDATAEQARQQGILDTQLKATTRSLEEQVGIVLGAVEADIRYHDAIQRATDAARDNGATTDLLTEAGRRNQQALIDLARATTDDEKAMQRNGASADQMRQFHDQSRSELIRQAQQMGFNADQARQLADRYLGVRNIGDITNTFLANTFPAVDAVNRMRDDINRAVQGITNEDIILRFSADTGNIMNAASGGPVLGRGTETSDSNLARLSHNEHVVTAQEVRGFGGHSGLMRARKLAASGQLPGFAQGGPVLWNSTETAYAQGIPEFAAANAAVIKKLASQAQAEVPAGGGAGVERWRGVGLQALNIAGQSTANIGKLLMQMQTESGGNPTIVNKWDSNWTAGHPSVGLMQVIAGTYRANIPPAYDRGPYSYGVSVDPLANILSATRYTVARYGSLAAGWQGHGYDQGGMWGHGAVGWNTSGRPERVLSPRQTESFERLVDLLSSRVGASAPRFDASTAAGSGMDLLGMVPVLRSAFASAIAGVFAGGMRADFDYDRLNLRLKKVDALNRRR